MEKMGWEKGRGLGASGQGNVDIITLKHKDDSKGIGFKGHDDTWIAHQDGFSSVLAALNAAHGPEEEAEVDIEIKENSTEEKKSLENTSKSRKKRVHYHKFTRGKDLSRYSATDLDCILGSQAVDRKRKKAVEVSDEENEEESSMTPMIGFQQNGNDAERNEDITQKEHGLVTIKRGSMSAYFAEKMAALKAKRNGSHKRTETCEKVETEETDEKIVSKKIKTTKESLLEASEEKDATIITELEIDTETTETTTELKKIKKAKRSKCEKAEMAVEQSDKEICGENVTDEEPVKKKSKKKKKDKKAIEETKEEAIKIEIKEEEEEEDQGSEKLGLKKKSKKSKNKDKLPDADNEEVLLDKPTESKCEIVEEQEEDTFVSKKKKSNRKEKSCEKVETKSDEQLSEPNSTKKSKKSKENLPEPTNVQDIVILEPPEVETTSKTINSKKRKNHDVEKDEKNEPLVSKKSKANEEEPQIVFEQVDVSGESNTIHKPPLIKKESTASPALTITSIKKLKSALGNPEVDEKFKQSVTEGFKGSNLTRVRGYSLAMATPTKKTPKKKKKKT